MLAEAYPESKTSVDKRKRTPLHFALGHTERPANVATVVLLSGTGAALMADENGMLVSSVQGMLSNEYPGCKDRCEGFIMYFVLCVRLRGEWGEIDVAC